MIIVDFSQIMIMSISSAFNSFKEELTEDMIRHIFLNVIREYRTKYSGEFGNELILACDGRYNWRKDYFPYYKFKRAQGRAESPLDWEFVFKCMDNLKTDIKTYFPYKLVEVAGCEGDDVIAVLVNEFARTRFVENKNAYSLDFDGATPEPILIISADKDFLQLQLYSNVKQYSPFKKGLITEPDIKYSRYLKILKGDVGDGVMNVFSDDDTLVTNKRQTVASQKRLAPLIESLMATDRLPDNTDFKIKRNFERNKTLIDLYELQIPDNLKLSIIDAYKQAPVNPRSEILKYLQKYQLKNLLSNIKDF